MARRRQREPTQIKAEDRPPAETNPTEELKRRHELADMAPPATPSFDPVRRADAALRRNVPPAVYEAGALDLPVDHPQRGPHAIADGRYRIVGSDLVLTFAGGELVTVELAHRDRLADVVLVNS